MTDAAGRQERETGREPCAECGAMCKPGEYHPYAFCVLHRGGLDPWRVVQMIAGQLNLGDPGPEPPKVWEIHEPSPAPVRVAHGPNEPPNE